MFPKEKAICLEIFKKVLSMPLTKKLESDSSFWTYNFSYFKQQFLDDQYESPQSLLDDMETKINSNVRDFGKDSLVSMGFLMVLGDFKRLMDENCILNQDNPLDLLFDFVEDMNKIIPDIPDNAEEYEQQLNDDFNEFDYRINDKQLIKPSFYSTQFATKEDIDATLKMLDHNNDPLTLKELSKVIKRHDPHWDWYRVGLNSISIDLRQLDRVTIDAIRIYLSKADSEKLSFEDELIPPEKIKHKNIPQAESDKLNSELEIIQQSNELPKYRTEIDTSLLDGDHAEDDLNNIG